MNLGKKHMQYQVQQTNGSLVFHHPNWIQRCEHLHTNRGSGFMFAMNRNRQEFFTSHQSLRTQTYSMVRKGDVVWTNSLVNHALDSKEDVLETIQAQID